MRVWRLVDTGHGPAQVELLVCDGCGKHAPENTSPEWIRVEKDLHTISEPQLRDFCGWQCLHGWIEGQRPRREVLLDLPEEAPSAAP